MHHLNCNLAAGEHQPWGLFPVSRAILTPKTQMAGLWSVGQVLEANSKINRSLILSAQDSSIVDFCLGLRIECVDGG